MNLVEPIVVWWNILDTESGINIPNPLESMHPSAIRVTSHVRPKSHDYCILGTLIGQKGWDHPSSLHSRRWRPKNAKKQSWMQILHRLPHDNLQIMFHGLSEVASSSTPRDRHDSNYGRPCYWYGILMKVKGSHKTMVTVVDLCVKWP